MMLGLGVKIPTLWFRGCLKGWLFWASWST